MVIVAVALSMSLVTAEDLLADHCGDHDCGGAADDSGACHGCLCCCPVAKMVALAPTPEDGIERPIGWVQLSSTAAVEGHHADGIDRPPRNSR